MRVYRLTFRTPGIFLDREVFKGNLTFEVRKDGEEEWKSVESAGILVIPEDKFTLNSVVVDLKPASVIDVPTRDKQNVTYYLVVPDSAYVEYRIIADHCPDCWDLFQETGRADQIIDTNNRRGKIIVGKGSFGEAS